MITESKHYKKIIEQKAQMKESSESKQFYKYTLLSL